jgi:hypothetical protein
VFDDGGGGVERGRHLLARGDVIVIRRRALGRHALEHARHGIERPGARAPRRDGRRRARPVRRRPPSRERAACLRSRSLAGTRTAGPRSAAAWAARSSRSRCGTTVAARRSMRRRVHLRRRRAGEQARALGRHELVGARRRHHRRTGTARDRHDDVDDGSGEALYVGGRFTRAGETTGTRHTRALGRRELVRARRRLRRRGETRSPSSTAAAERSSTRRRVRDRRRRRGARDRPLERLALGAARYSASAISARACTRSRCTTPGKGRASSWRATSRRPAAVAAQNLAAWDGHVLVGDRRPAASARRCSRGGPRTTEAVPLCTRAAPSRASAASRMSGVARWDGTAWSPLGEGVGGIVRALAGTSRGLRVGGDLPTTARGRQLLANWGASRRATRER